MIPKIPNPDKDRRSYEFGPFRLDVGERLLLRGDEVVAIKGKTLDMLVLLVENPGRLLEKEWLLKTLWPDTFVEEVNLNVNVSAVRKALGETVDRPQYIKTIPKRGYRFIAKVTAAAPEGFRTHPGLETGPERADRPVDAVAAQATPVPPASARYEAMTGETGQGDAQVPSPTVPALPLGPAAHRGEQASPGPPAISPPRRSYWKRRAILGSLVCATAVAAFLFWYVRLRDTRDRGIESIRSVGVLPFKTASGNEEDMALGLGMADAIITRLSNTRRIIVRPISAVLKYAAKDQDPFEAGNALGVEAVLTGFVQKDGKTVRISTQMIRVSDGATLWASRFDDSFTNLFAVQDSISERMVDALSMRLTAVEQSRMMRRYTEDPEAYQLYSEARYLYFNHQFERSLDLYQASIARDPAYPLAHAGLAMSCVALAVSRPDRQKMRDEAMSEATQALSLGPDLDEAHDALGLAKFRGDWDWTGAEHEFHTAIELNPNNSSSRQNYAILLDILGRYREAMREIERARQLDPVSPEILRSEALVLFHSGEYDRALEESRKAAESSGDRSSDTLTPRVYAAASRFGDIMKQSDRGEGLQADAWLLYTGCAYAHLGRRDQAQAVLQTFLRKAAERGSIGPVAVMYAALGDKDRAIEWLRKAYSERDSMMIHLKVDPEWNGLRSDPRFTELLRSMGFQSVTAAQP